MLLDPGAQVWIDVVIGRADPLWQDDIGRSSLWLGEVWVEALRAVGIEGSVHRGPMVTTPMSPIVCFAGLASGEVSVGNAKVVGISQRRTRAGARFQCSVPVTWDAHRHGQLLAPGLRRIGGTIDEVEVAAVDPVVDGTDLREAFIDSLP